MAFTSAPRRAAPAARRHDVARHVGVIGGFVIGGLGIAGIAASLPGRRLRQAWFG